MTSITPFKLSPKGYFVYHDGADSSLPAKAKLEFEIQLTSDVEQTDLSWIDGVLADIKSALINNKPLTVTVACKQCKRPVASHG